MDHIKKGLKALFENKAEAFTRGRLDEAVRSLSIPSTIVAGDHKLFLSSYKAAVSTLSIYRNNLVVEDYAKTSVDVLQCTKYATGAVQAFVHWMNFNSKGAEINTFDACYLCSQKADQTWRIDSVEFVARPHERLANGIPFEQYGIPFKSYGS